MTFTDKLLKPMTERVDDIYDDVSTRMDSLSDEVETVTAQVLGLAALGMIAFTLISIVAVTALVKASK
jgi:hypothetical protein